MELKDKKFVCIWFFVNWRQISLGINIDLGKPNIEIHLPFGFIKIGIDGIENYTKEQLEKKRTYGIELYWR